MRYIHHNPEKAGICHHAEYRWSSYRFYIDDSAVLPEIKAILQIFSKSTTLARRQFQEYSQEISTDDILDLTPLQTTEIDAENIEAFIAQFLSENGLTRQELLDNKDWARLLIGQILKESNLSMRKIAMVIGINRETVRKLSEEPSPRQETC